MNPRPIDPAPRRRAGLTVIELVVSAAIFLMFFLAAMEGWPLSHQAVQQAKRVLLASHIAQQQMETALFQVNGSFTTDHSVPLPPSTSPPAVTLQSINNGNTQSLDYYYTVSAPGGGTPKDVVVNVWWFEPGATGKSVKRQITLETMVAGP